MKTFKSFIATAAIAASTLGFVVLSTPAQAGPGLVFQGIELNGLKFNGLKFNGLKFNGIKLNGPGVVIQGTQTGRIVAVSLASGEVVRLAK